MKMQNRRQFHERRAAAMREQQRQACCDDSHWVEPLLDDALAQLRESDRNAVLLSYMAGKSWREVAASLGTTEEAARKRVTRAVAQLRGMVARRGVATTGAAIAAVLTTSAEASVPPTLLGSVTAALASTTGGAGGAAAAGSASSIIAKGALHMMTWAHVKVAAAGAAVLLGTLGGAGAMVLHQQPTPRPAPATAPAIVLVPAEIKPGRFAATFQDGVTVELLALSKRGGNDRTWWAPDGAPTDHKFNESTSQDDPPHSHQAVVHVSGPGVADFSTMFVLPDIPGWSAQPASQGNAQVEGMQVVTFRAKDGAESIDLTVKIASGEWETLSTKADHDGVVINVTPAGGGIAWGQTIDENGRTAVAVSDTLKGVERRMIAVDPNGNEHEPSERSMAAGGNLSLSSVKFDLPLDQIAEVRFQARSFDQTVVFRNVSLVGGKKSDAKVEVVEEK
jgi:hypothetical protein